MASRTTQRAFTLIELAIVLVIIGLIVGGVLAGRALIRAAELRAITTEAERYETAFYAFRDKFNAIPGDMPTAYNFFGDVCGTDTSTQNTGCNGNGNYVVDAWSNTSENLKLWEHLALAGFIAGQFDGTGTHLAGNGGTTALSASNIPRSKFSEGFWDFSTQQFNIGGSPPQNSGLYLTIGSPGGQEFLDPLPSMTMGEAWSIDVKADDGWANTGKVRGYIGTCIDGAGDAYFRVAVGAETAGYCRLTYILSRSL